MDGIYKREIVSYNNNNNNNNNKELTSKKGSLYVFV